MNVSYEVEGLSRSFGPVKAVADASFGVRAGCVHGVIGKNGAGKSVLMNMIAGVLTPSGGTLRIDGQVIDTARWNPRTARDAGVALIPQEPPDFPYLTAADYMQLGVGRGVRFGVTNPATAKRWVAELDERLELGVLATDMMTDLPIEVQQLLAFGKAVHVEKARIILLDEITASLTAARKQALLKELRALKDEVSFTLISHRVSEIKVACDTVTVMRDGRSVETLEVSETDAERLASAIVGDADTQPEMKSTQRELGPVSLTATGIVSGTAVRGVDLEVRKGEVVGLAGLDGSGKDEIIEVLAGLRPAQGEFHVDGRRVSVRSPRSANRAGMVLLPKKREELATIHGMSVYDNVAIPAAADFSLLPGIMDNRKLRRLSQQYISQMKVKTPSLETDIDNLSGGNKQKVMMARLQLQRPSVYLLNEPTRGVDIATIPELLRVVREQLATQAAVVLTSESEEELLVACDRILVIVDGQVAKEIRRGDQDFTVGNIYRLGQGVSA